MPLSGNLNRLSMNAAISFRSDQSSLNTPIVRWSPNGSEADIPVIRISNSVLRLMVRRSCACMTIRRPNSEPKTRSPSRSDAIKMIVRSGSTVPLGDQRSARNETNGSAGVCWFVKLSGGHWIGNHPNAAATRLVIFVELSA